MYMHNTHNIIQYMHNTHNIIQYMHITLKDCYA